MPNALGKDVGRISGKWRIDRLNFSVVMTVSVLVFKSRSSKRLTKWIYDNTDWHHWVALMQWPAHCENALLSMKQLNFDLNAVTLWVSLHPIRITDSIDQVAKKIYDSALGQRYSTISCTYASHLPHNPRWKGKCITCNKHESATFSLRSWKAEIKKRRFQRIWNASAQSSL